MDRLGLVEPDGLIDGLSEVERLPDGEIDGLNEVDNEPEGEIEVDKDGEAEGEADRLRLGLTEVEGE